MSAALTRQTQFEVHQIGVPENATGATVALPYRDKRVPLVPTVLPVALEDGTVWARIDENTKRLCRAGPADLPVVGFRVVPRQLNPVLAMVVRGAGVLVDSIPALPLAVLTTKSSLVLGENCRCYITKRITPHVGPPTSEMVDQHLKCDFCAIPITDAPDPKNGLVTRVITHACGAVYHFETAESHPGVSADDLLTCRDKVRNCLVCQRPIVTESHLAWTPSADSRVVRVEAEALH